MDDSVKDIYRGFRARDRNSGDSRVSWLATHLLQPEGPFRQKFILSRGFFEVGRFE